MKLDELLETMDEQRVEVTNNNGIGGAAYLAKWEWGWTAKDVLNECPCDLYVVDYVTIDNGHLKVYADERNGFYESDNICDITWSRDDLCYLLDRKEIEHDAEFEDEMMDYIYKGLRDRSIEEGWEIMDTLIDLFMYEKKEN